MASEKESVKSELDARYELLRGAIAALEALGVQNAERLAATDVFIEKAQRRLTVRAIKFFWAGAVLALATFLFLGGGLYLIYEHSLGKDVADLAPLDGLKAGLLILRGTTVTAFVLGAAYVAFSFARAFFHEGTNSLNRRHALRFGRLYVYLKSGNIVFRDLERAFNWNIENSTAFKDIKTEPITATVAGKLAEQPAKVAGAIRSPSNKRKDA